MEDKKNMASKNERIKELAEQLIELVSESDECETNSVDPDTKTTEEMKELAKRDDYIGTIARAILKIMEDLDEIKADKPYNPLCPGIQPYQPNTIQPSVPWPPQVWYRYDGYEGAFGPVKGEYHDTDGRTNVTTTCTY